MRRPHSASVPESSWDTCVLTVEGEMIRRTALCILHLVAGKITYMLSTLKTPKNLARTRGGQMGRASRAGPKYGIVGLARAQRGPHCSWADAGTTQPDGAGMVAARRGRSGARGHGTAVAGREHGTALCWHDYGRWDRAGMIDHARHGTLARVTCLTWNGGWV